MKSEIALLSDPAKVLGQLRQIEDDYLRVTARFPFGKMLEDAEGVAGPIDVPPFVDNRLKSAIAEIKILINQTLAKVCDKPEKS